MIDYRHYKKKKKKKKSVQGLLWGFMNPFTWKLHIAAAKKKKKKKKNNQWSPTDGI